MYVCTVRVQYSIHNTKYTCIPSTTPHLGERGGGVLAIWIQYIFLYILQYTLGPEYTLSIIICICVNVRGETCVLRTVQGK